MISKWLITGDTHRDFSRFYPLFKETTFQQEYSANKTAIIILGDAGINFFLDERDREMKNKLSNTGYVWYLVRGNHEERPQNLGDIINQFDEIIQGNIWVEKDFPNIRYFIDGEIYNINGYKTLVIGGAYSVDKYYRLAKCGIYNEMQGNRDYIQRFGGWFFDEQLTRQEQEEILNKVEGKDFNLVLTHTCPVQWEPTDLFLAGIDQSTVDKSTEYFLSEVEANVNYDRWLWGHYHAEREVNEKARMLYKDIYDLNDLMI